MTGAERKAEKEAEGYKMLKTQVNHRIGLVTIVSGEGWYLEGHIGRITKSNYSAVADYILNQLPNEDPLSIAARDYMTTGKDENLVAVFTDHGDGGKVYDGSVRIAKASIDAHIEQQAAGQKQ